MAFGDKSGCLLMASHLVPDGVLSSSGWRPRHPLMPYGKTRKSRQAQNCFDAEPKCHGEDAMTNGERTP